MILLTGSTGCLGSQLLGRLLASERETRLALLLRSGPSGTAESRCYNLLTELFGEVEAKELRSRIELIDADITVPGWGLTPDDFNRLASQVSSITHCAATTSLDVSWDTAEKVNIRGTEQLLSFALQAAKHNPNFTRLNHVSTAYVAGDTEAIVQADYLNLSGRFRNSYEQSKAVSETAVRSHAKEIPTTIFRPSIIVGDSVTGHTSTFNVIYIPAKMLVNGFFSSFPAYPQAVFDVVPIDYAANTIFSLINKPEAIGRSFHITSGVGRESCLREIIEFLFATFNKYRIRGMALAMPPFVSPELMASLAQNSLNMALSSVRTIEKMVSDHIKVLRKTLPFVPYMTSNPRFDNGSTVATLGGDIALPPLFSSYAEQLFKFCLDTNWGKNPLPGSAPQFRAPQFRAPQFRAA